MRISDWSSDVCSSDLPSDENSVQDLEHTVTAPPAVVLKPTDFNLNDWLWAGSISAAAFVGQMTMVLFLVFFAPLSGDTFKRKLVRLTGPSLSNKKITVQILADINTDRKSTRLNSSHSCAPRMPSSA